MHKIITLILLCFICCFQIEILAASNSTGLIGGISAPSFFSPKNKLNISELNNISSVLHNNPKAVININYNTAGEKLKLAKLAKKIKNHFIDNGIDKKRIKISEIYLPDTELTKYDHERVSVVILFNGFPDAKTV